MSIVKTQDIFGGKMMLFRKKTEGAEISMDYSLHNFTAEQWALQNAGSTYSDLSQQELEVIKQAIAKFVKVPSYTVGDVAKLMTEYFDKEKALNIAITEITRAYAFAEQIDGEELKKVYPDVRVIKTWFTNNDSYVCEICKSLDGKIVDIDKPFSKGIFIPPAHEGCRCWISSRTKII